MAQTPEVDRFEGIVQKLEGLAQDADLYPIFSDIATEFAKRRVLVGEFTPDQ